MVGAIRDWMKRHDFIEVETPILQALAGGAVARPFLTHHNALDREVSLRVSTELYLRRCTVGDLERVYELGKCFRNEGMSRRHSPEFTMLEWSMAYSDYQDAATLTEELVTHVAKQVLGDLRITYDGIPIDLKTPWRRVTLQEAIKDRTGLDILGSNPKELLAALGATPTRDCSWTDAVYKLYGTCVEPYLGQPTIVCDFPLDAHPCLRQHSTRWQLGESFDVVVGGLEIGSGGTELSDPDEQRLRFIEQRSDRADGHEPHPNDREYVAALEYGAPPSAGVGIGIDRLLMVLLDIDPIGEATLFATTG
jgi:lysyl-tRNA synthetase class 2